MQRTTIATAIVLVVAGLSAGVSTLPLATAGHTNCHKDFDIADSRVLANNRTLPGGDSEVGREDVAADDRETLNIELLTGGDTLEWTVYEKSGSNCVVYDDGGCNGSTPNEITDRSRETCDLINDGSTAKNFYVLFENPETDQLSYMSWSS